MANDSNVVSFSGQKPPERLVLPQALVRLRDVSAHTLKQVMGSFFDRTDDALFELADRLAPTLTSPPISTPCGNFACVESP